MGIPLKGLSRGELLNLQKRVEKALIRLQKADKKKALAAAQAAAKQHGFSLDELTTGGAGNGRKAKKTSVKGVPKYAHPKDPSITWTGKGRRPQWIVDAMDKGKKLSAFEIK